MAQMSRYRNLGFLMLLSGVFSLGSACKQMSVSQMAETVSSVNPTQEPEQRTKANHRTQTTASPLLQPGSAIATGNGSNPSNEVKLNPVPPGGTENLSPLELRYFQGMGALEYAARLTGIPKTAAWRIRIRLYPENAGGRNGLSYRVKVDHYNLSPSLYRELIESYGQENVDRSLADRSPHQHFEMIFMPGMNVAAELVPDSVQRSQSDVSQNPRDCGIGIGCADVEFMGEGEHWTDERSIDLEFAPWEELQNPNQANGRVYGMVRGLAKQSGKIQSSGWVDGEIPEGLSDKRAWIEVLIDNRAGNSDNYQALWIEHAADDSIQASVYLMYSGDRTANSAFVSRSSICSRGGVAGQLRARCP